MMICSGSQLKKSFAGTVIFEDLQFEIKDGEKIGLVGRNGSGKTTLFKCISKIESPDSGTIAIKKGAKVGYLAQIPTFASEMTGRNVLESAFGHLVKVEKELKQLEWQMATNVDSMESLLERYGSLQEEFTRNGGYEMESRIARMINGLELGGLVEKPFQKLSGGEQTKVCLGYILLQEPELLLLDEPTNHLDIMAVEWLEGFLNEYPGAVMMISHDRYFLDTVVKKVYDLEEGELTIYHGNYSTFVKEKEERLLQEFQAYQEQQKKIKKMKEAIKRLKEWANQANPPNEGLHKRARNMERALERMEKLKRPVIEAKKMDLSFTQLDRSGKDALKLIEVNKGFQQQTLLKEANMLVQYGDRTAIVGRNGTGKSTIVKMVLGLEAPDSGVVKVGSNVRIGYLSQTTDFQDVEMRVIDVFRDKVPMVEGEARHILARFMFYGEGVFRKVKGLSGGEKMRLRLAQLMHQDINFLLLDEPTNHLDIDSKEVLEDALEDFRGTILTVSHDRYFLNKLFSKTYWIQDQKLHYFEGPYSWAKSKIQKERVNLSIEAETNTTKDKKVEQEKQEPNKNKPINEIEAKIEEIEEELLQLQEEMMRTEDLTQLQMLQEKKDHLEEQKDQLESEWIKIVDN
ncbi:ABC transporter ATP-binding protein [Bacillus coahuilensis p1.1.43]|uniref:ABC transporter ATP-binding protein n=1 Tax=Bacillus coahuilensis p1.1.43 TaxID=1150625 RepID=A0A147KC24_9BACI|nr:ABC-F family ATP-binding cassette domain-containing protein [Bacillus coahuilensis]KUP09102.1 ABC transporter ATP-binding protein [Bacillus coahuilensis p1.1.43]